MTKHNFFMCMIRAWSCQRKISSAYVIAEETVIKLMNMAVILFSVFSVFELHTEIKFHIFH